MSEIIGKLVDLGIMIKADGSPQQKVKCPNCNDQRSNKRDRSLSVNIVSGLFKCHYCHWTGCAIPNEDDKKYVRPEESKNKSLSPETIEFFKQRCISETTLKALKITEEDEWMPQFDAIVKTAVFNYYQNSVLINKKYRSIDGKGFRMVKDAKLIFYNLDGIVNEKDVIITEGEFDAISFFEAGFRNVVSVPNGANKGSQKLEYLDHGINYFEGVEKIYLAVDNDDSGESLFQELSRRLGKERCYRVHYPNECKDANDVLINHGIEGVQELVNTATELPIEGIVDVTGEYESILELYNTGIERGEELDEFGQEFNTICTFQTGKLYVITGIPSHGKSSFLEDIQINLAVEKGWKFAIFSPEHFPVKYMIYKYAEILVGKPFFVGHSERMSVQQLDKAIEFIREHFFFIRPKDEMYTLDNILDISRNLVMRHGIKGLTIDPWNTIAHDFGGKSETQYIEDALNRITLWKQVNDVAVFVVAHPKKMQKQQSGENAGLHEVPTLYDIAGSSNFFNKADMGICIYRNFKEGLTYFYMQKVKYRNLGEVGVCTFKYNALNNRFEPAQYEPSYADDPAKVTKIRHKNMLQEEVEQVEISMTSTMKPNMEFDDDLPF
jgi:twinkle protein